jgi:predicted exporter
MNRTRNFITIAWLIVLISAAWIVAHANFRADISAFLPKHPTENQKLLVEQLTDGVVSRLMLIGIDGAEPDALVALSQATAAALRKEAAQSRIWKTVQNGEAVGLERDGKFLFEHRYLLSDVAPSTWTEDGLNQALANARAALAGSAGMFSKELLPRDPTGEMTRMIESLAARNTAPTRGGVWIANDEFGKPRAVLMAQTIAAGSDLDAQADAIRAVEAAFANAKAKLAAQNNPRVATATNATLSLAGPGAFSAMSRERIQQDATAYSTIALAMVVVLIWLVYRSPRVMVLGLLPVVTGIVVGIATVALVFDHVHGITLGFGATLIGEAVDYGVYLVTLIRKKDGATAGQDAHSTMARIWPTLRLGVWTSVCGFAAMIFSGFPGLQQLGLFSIAGLATAALVTRWVLPHWLPADFQIRHTTLASHLARIATYAPRFRLPLAVIVFLLVLLGIFFRQTVWNDDLANVSPISLAEQKRDEALRNAIGAPDVRYMVVAEAKTTELALVAAERSADALTMLVARNALRAFDTPSQFLPSAAAQEARRTALPDSTAIAPALARATDASGFSSGTFQPFLTDLAAAKTQKNITRDALNGTELAAQVDALLQKREGSTTAMLPLHGVADEATLRATIQSIAKVDGANVRLLDLKTETNSLYQSYRHQALFYALLGLLAIAALLWLTLRSITRTVRLLFPLIAAVVVTASILLALGVSLSIFHLVAFLLVIGVGSNYALFFDQQHATVNARSSTESVLLALIVCNLSTIFGFGILAFSSMPVLQAIGGTVAIGAFLSLIFSATYISPAVAKHEKSDATT